jgi:hypothetical protein
MKVTFRTTPVSARFTVAISSASPAIFSSWDGQQEFFGLTAPGRDDSSVRRFLVREPAYHFRHAKQWRERDIDDPTSLVRSG